MKGFTLKKNVPEFKVQDSKEGLAGKVFKHNAVYENIPSSMNKQFDVVDKSESKPPTSSKKSKFTSIKKEANTDCYNQEQC